MAERTTEPKGQASSPLEKEKISASNPPSPSRHTYSRHASHSHPSEGRATVLLYCLTVVLMVFLVGSILNGIGLFPPAIAAATSTFGGALAAVLGVLGGLLAGSILQEGFKKI